MSAVPQEVTLVMRGLTLQDALVQRRRWIAIGEKLLSIRKAMEADGASLDELRPVSRSHRNCAVMIKRYCDLVDVLSGAKETA